MASGSILNALIWSAVLAYECLEKEIRNGRKFNYFKIVFSQIYNHDLGG